MVMLVYAFDHRDPAKQSIGLSLLRERGAQLVLSTQMQGEFYPTVTRKLPHPLPPADAEQAVRDTAAPPVVGVDAALVNAAVSTGSSISCPIGTR